MENFTPKIYQIYRDNIGSIVMYASSANTKSLYYSPWGQRLQSATGNTPTYFSTFVGYSVGLRMEVATKEKSSPIIGLDVSSNHFPCAEK